MFNRVPALSGWLLRIYPLYTFETELAKHQCEKSILATAKIAKSKNTNYS